MCQFRYESALPQHVQVTPLDHRAGQDADGGEHKGEGGLQQQALCAQCGHHHPRAQTPQHSADMQTSIGESPLGTFCVPMHRTSDCTRLSGAGGASPCCRRVISRLKGKRMLCRGGQGDLQFDSSFWLHTHGTGASGLGLVGYVRVVLPICIQTQPESWQSDGEQQPQKSGSLL